MPEIIKTKYTKNFKIPQVLASAVYEIPIPQESIDEHRFFNELLIFNMDAVDIEMMLDGSLEKVFPVPSKSSIVFSFKEDNWKFNKLTLTNLNAVTNTTANKIYCTVKKKRIDIGGE